MKHREICRISAEHPALPGHFPAWPLVPGTLILQEVLRAAYAWRDKKAAPLTLSWVKFTAPLFPGQDFVLEMKIREDQPDQLKFTCVREATTLASGVFTWQGG